MEQAGHSVTSRWLDADSVENAATALRDLADVAASDGIILFCEEPRTATRGGRLVEFGFAIALDKVLIAIGETAENIFLYLPAIQRFETWTECLAALAALSRRKSGRGGGVKENAASRRAGLH